VEAESRQLADHLKELGAHLRAAEIEAVLPLFAHRRVKAGDVIIAESTDVHEAFIVATGSVIVSARVAGKSVELGRLGEGSLVGEVSFLDGRPASASVAAAEDSDLLALDRRAFDGFEGSHPRAAMEIVHAFGRTLAGRIRSATDRLEDLRGGTDPADHHGFMDAFRSLLGMRLS
jgi:CRP-like cAMP-binding protein